MRTSVESDDEIASRFDMLADARRRPAALAQEAVRQYVERENARESFRLEALAPGPRTGADGRHLTANEVVSKTTRSLSSPFAISGRAGY